MGPLDTTPIAQPRSTSGVPCLLKTFRDATPPSSCSGDIHHCKKNERSVEPEPLVEPSPKGHQDSTRPTLPFGSVAQALPLMVESPRAQVGDFRRSSNLTHTRHVSNCLHCRGLRHGLGIPFLSTAGLQFPRGSSIGHPFQTTSIRIANLQSQWWGKRLSHPRQPHHR
jgi:hypothetical protein